MKLKQIIAIILSALVIMLQTGCGRDSETGEIMEYDKYNIETYLTPLWDGNYVYNETVMFVGENSKSPLMYKAEEIISVRSYDLKTEYLYRKDYLFDEKKNRLYLTENTSVPFISSSDYYPETYIGGQTIAFNGAEHNYIRFSEGEFFPSRQIAVTYKHSGKDYISRPVCQSEAFLSVREKIEAGEKVKILFYGDSITVGANSSKFINYAPFVDTWTEMVYNTLTKGRDNTEYINTAQGGWNSQDGLNNLDDCVLSYQPDAVFIAFGMNDVSLSPEQHISRIKTMFLRIRESLPDCAVCFISNMFPNPEAKGFWGSQAYFNEEYYGLMEELSSQGETAVCFADVTKVHSEILKRKRYFDMTGNNVNHPNDFLVRVYAQTVLQTICDDF